MKLNHQIVAPLLNIPAHQQKKKTMVETCKKLKINSSRHHQNKIDQTLSSWYTTKSTETPQISCYISMKPLDLYPLLNAGLVFFTPIVTPGPSPNNGFVEASRLRWLSIHPSTSVAIENPTFLMVWKPGNMGIFMGILLVSGRVKPEKLLTPGLVVN